MKNKTNFLLRLSVIKLQTIDVMDDGVCVWTKTEKRFDSEIIFSARLFSSQKPVF